MQHQRKTLPLLGLAALTLAATHSAQADTITFNSYTASPNSYPNALATDTEGSFTVTFEPGDWYSAASNSVDSSSSVFTDPGPGYINVTRTTGGDYFTFSQVDLVDEEILESMNITYTLTGFDGATQIFTSTAAQKGTHQIASPDATSPITDLRITISKGTYDIDNIVVSPADAPAAPEPSTRLPFAFTALAAMGLMLKVKRRRAA